MASLELIEELGIETDKVFYDLKSKFLSVYILDFVFIGVYKKNIRVSKVLDDIYASLENISFKRDEIYFVDHTTKQKIHGNKKLKNLKLQEKKTEAKEEDTTVSTRDKKHSSEELQRKKKAKAAKPSTAILEEAEKEAMEDAFFYDVDEEKPFPAPAAPPPPPGGAPATGGAPAGPTPREEVYKDMERALKAEATEKGKVAAKTAPPQLNIYEINLGLQYYSVMMEMRSYLFYVYFSHKELQIVDEEGKVIFETSFKIETYKKEPPVLNVRIEGEGFETHPLYGNVVVTKSAVNPPVMIFSVLPVKSDKKTKKQKKEGEKRFLHLYIEFEEKIINHSVLSIIVQPKHYHVDIGPLHFNLSKPAAMLVSFSSIVIAAISLVYTIFSIEPSSSIIETIGSFWPGIGALAFFALFLYTLFTEGIYPLKEKVYYFLNFDKSGVLIK